jgi:hypothetical protein
VEFISSRAHEPFRLPSPDFLDVVTNTLHVESDELLDQHTHALI